VTPTSTSGGSGSGADAGTGTRSDAGSETGPLSSPARVVRVRRTGGFAGLSADGEVDLESDEEVRSLVERIDLSVVRAEPPYPDMYVYDFDLLGTRAVVPEQHLTSELRRLADLVLGRGEGARQGGLTE
jgi:hypothetical protein